MKDDKKKPTDKNTQEENIKPVVQDQNYVEKFLEKDFHDTSHDPPDDNPREEFEGK